VSRAVLCAMLLVLLASSGMALAQPVRDDGAERERAFIEGLRSEDPASGPIGSSRSAMPNGRPWPS